MDLGNLKSFLTPCSLAGGASGSLWEFMKRPATQWPQGLWAPDICAEGLCRAGTWNFLTMHVGRAVGKLSRATTRGTVPMVRPFESFSRLFGYVPLAKLTFRPNRKRPFALLAIRLWPTLDCRPGGTRTTWSVGCDFLPPILEISKMQKTDPTEGTKGRSKRLRRSCAVLSSTWWFRACSLRRRCWEAVYVHYFSHHSDSVTLLPFCLPTFFRHLNYSLAEAFRTARQTWLNLFCKWIA